MDKNPGCTHAKAHQLPEGAYAAPIGKCRCCGFLFVYIGMGMAGGSWGEDCGADFSETTMPDATLCAPCGGRSMVLKTVGDVVVEYDPGSHGPASADEAMHYTPAQPDLSEHLAT